MTQIIKANKKNYKQEIKLKVDTAEV